MPPVDRGGGQESMQGQVTWDPALQLTGSLLLPQSNDNNNKVWARDSVMQRPPRKGHRRLRDQGCKNQRRGNCFCLISFSNQLRPRNTNIISPEIKS